MPNTTSLLHARTTNKLIRLKYCAQGVDQTVRITKNIEEFKGKRHLPCTSQFPVAFLPMACSRAAAVAAVSSYMDFVVLYASKKELFCIHLCSLRELMSSALVYTIV